jgi:RNA recognition motif-containing protein
MNIYVGNLPYSVSDSELRSMFEAFGDVDSAAVILDRDTRRSKGFGFVEMPNQEQAEEAIEKLNNSDCEGRNLKINEARPREDRGGGRGGRRF